MKSTHIVLCLLFFMLSNVFAQAQTLKDYETKTIYLQTGTFIKDGVKKNMGFFNNNLKKEMASVPTAAIAFQDYERTRNKSFIFSLVGLGTVLSAAFFEDNQNLQNSLLLGGLGISIVSIPFSIKAGNQLHRSVWVYNRDVVF